MKVYLSRDAIKQYGRIPARERSKIKRKLEALEKDPFLGKKLAGEPSGLHSVRAWPYRIIYTILRTKELWVVSILHRQGAYK